jgi:electron transfer flavoprotein alpha subunit
MSVLIIVEHDNSQMNPGTLSVVTAAGQLSKDIVALVIGYQNEAVAQQVAQIQGIQKVILINHLCHQHFLPEVLAPSIAEIAKHYSHTLMPSTSFGKNILPRVAALLDLAPVSDVLQIIAEDTFVRPLYAGNALATVQSQDPIKMLTIRTTAFAAAKPHENGAPLEILNSMLENRQSRWLNMEQTPSERPELTAARVVVAGGRGLQNAENFQKLLKLAELLNAAIGASRAAVDAGFAPNDWQVGQTGKIVAPELYIAIGISGAIQHLAGMKDSKVIVAINKDAEAPIFQVADYGLVGDLFKFLPELELALRERGGKSC